MGGAGENTNRAIKSSCFSMTGPSSCREGHFFSRLNSYQNGTVMVSTGIDHLLVVFETSTIFFSYS